MNASKDFSKICNRMLKERGVIIISSVIIPDMGNAMPYANGTIGYNVDDNGTGRVLSYREVIERSTRSI